MENEPINFQEELKDVKMDFSGQVLTEDSPEWKTAIIKGKVQKVGTFPLRDILTSCRTGQIWGYVNNRGSGKPSRVTVKEVKNNFNPSIIGQFGMTILKNGKWELVDSHGRNMGIIERLRDNLFDISELNTLVSISLCHEKDKLDNYKGINTHKPQTLRQTLANKDLLFLSYITEIIEKYSKLNAKNKTLLYNQAYYPIMADILWTCHEKNQNPSIKINDFCDVYCYRHIVTKHAPLNSNNIKLFLTENDKISIGKGFKYFATFLARLLNMEAFLKKTVKIKTTYYRDFNSAGLLGVLVTDIVFCKQNRKFYRSPVKIADACISRGSKIIGRLPSLTQSRREEMQKGINEVNKLVRGELK